jgi:hypothetical protein
LKNQKKIRKIKFQMKLWLPHKNPRKKKLLKLKLTLIDGLVLLEPKLQQLHSSMLISVKSLLNHTLWQMKKKMKCFIKLL